MHKSPSLPVGASSSFPPAKLAMGAGVVMGPLAAGHGMYVELAAKDTGAA